MMRGCNQQTCCTKKRLRVFAIALTCFSGVLFVFCLFFVVYGILSGHSNFFPSVPPPVQLVILFLLIFILGCLEGTQISYVKTFGAHIEAFSESHPRAFKNILYASSENHLQEYLMGRQLLTVAVVFLISRLTTFLSWQTFPFSDTVVPAGFKGAFYDSGMLGVVVVTIAGQLTPQLLCETYPVRTLNIKFVGAVTIGTCVGVEKLGITHFSYALSAFLVWFFKRVNPRAFGGQSFSPAGQAKELSSTLKRLLDEDHLISSLAEDDDVYKAVDSVKLLSRETFRKGSDSLERFPPIVGGKHYASPAEIATQLLEAGLASEQIPRFLLSPTDPQHIPPHVVAIKLMGLLSTVKGLTSISSNGITEVSETNARELEEIVL